ncbi:unnamed protein product [Amoebophrya sp. A25]|nr:unnamed protein product [Amoebophrya sp. A25]|eukprot:GSA25T00000129001.1
MTEHQHPLRAGACRAEASPLKTARRSFASFGGAALSARSGSARTTASQQNANSALVQDKTLGTTNAARQHAQKTRKKVSHESQSNKTTRTKADPAALLATEPTPKTKSRTRGSTRTKRGPAGPLAVMKFDEENKENVVMHCLSTGHGANCMWGDGNVAGEREDLLTFTTSIKPSINNVSSATSSTTTAATSARRIKQEGGAVPVPFLATRATTQKHVFAGKNSTKQKISTASSSGAIPVAGLLTTTRNRNASRTLSSNQQLQTLATCAAHANASAASSSSSASAGNSRVFGSFANATAASRARTRQTSPRRSRMHSPVITEREVSGIVVSASGSSSRRKVASSACTTADRGGAHGGAGTDSRIECAETSDAAANGDVVELLGALSSASEPEVAQDVGKRDLSCVDLKETMKPNKNGVASGATTTTHLSCSSISAGQHGPGSITGKVSLLHQQENSCVSTAIDDAGSSPIPYSSQDSPFVIDSPPFVEESREKSRPPGSKEVDPSEPASNTLRGARVATTFEEEDQGVVSGATTVGLNSGTTGAFRPSTTTAVSPSVADARVKMSAVVMSSNVSQAQEVQSADKKKKWESNTKIAAPSTGHHIHVLHSLLSGGINKARPSIWEDPALADPFSKADATVTTQQAAATSASSSSSAAASSSVVSAGTASTTRASGSTTTSITNTNTTSTSSQRPTSKANVVATRPAASPRGAFFNSVGNTIPAVGKNSTLLATSSSGNTSTKGVEERDEVKQKNVTVVVSASGGDLIKSGIGASVAGAASQTHTPSAVSYVVPSGAAGKQFVPAPSSAITSLPTAASRMGLQPAYTSSASTSSSTGNSIHVLSGGTTGTSGASTGFGLNLDAFQLRLPMQIGARLSTTNGILASTSTTAVAAGGVKSAVSVPSGVRPVAGQVGDKRSSLSHPQNSTRVSSSSSTSGHDVSKAVATRTSAINTSSTTRIISGAAESTSEEQRPASPLTERNVAAAASSSVPRLRPPAAVTDEETASCTTVELTTATSGAKAAPSATTTYAGGPTPPLFVPSSSASSSKQTTGESAVSSTVPSAARHGFSSATAFEDRVGKQFEGTAPGRDGEEESCARDEASSTPASARPGSLEVATERKRQGQKKAVEALASCAALRPATDEGKVVSEEQGEEQPAMKPHSSGGTDEEGLRYTQRGRAEQQVQVTVSGDTATQEVPAKSAAAETQRRSRAQSIPRGGVVRPQTARGHTRQQSPRRQAQTARGPRASSPNLRTTSDFKNFALTLVSEAGKTKVEELKDVVNRASGASATNTASSTRPTTGGSSDFQPEPRKSRSSNKSKKASCLDAQNADGVVAASASPVVAAAATSRRTHANRETSIREQMTNTNYEKTIVQSSTAVNNTTRRSSPPLRSSIRDSSVPARGATMSSFLSPGATTTQMHNLLGSQPSSALSRIADPDGPFPGGQGRQVKTIGKYRPQPRCYAGSAIVYSSPLGTPALANRKLSVYTEKNVDGSAGEVGSAEGRVTSSGGDGDVVNFSSAPAPSVRPASSAGSSSTSATFWLYGGTCDTNSGIVPFSDLWELNLQTLQWTQHRHPAGTTPGPLCKHSMVAWRHYLVIFGGWNGTRRCNAVWFYDTQKHVWTEVLNTKPGKYHMADAIWPPPHTSHAVCLVDSDVMLVVGRGETGTHRKYGSDIDFFDCYNRVWMLGGARFNARAGHSLTPLAEGRVLMYGGRKDHSIDFFKYCDFCPFPDAVRQTGKVAEASTVPLAVPGMVPVAPPFGRSFHQVVTLVPNHLHLLHGGFLESSHVTGRCLFDATRHTVLYDEVTGTWYELAADRREDHTSLFFKAPSPAHDSGGLVLASACQISSGGSTTCSDGVGGEQEAGLKGAAPSYFESVELLPPRAGHCLHAMEHPEDARKKRVVLFGGTHCGVNFNDVWFLDLDIRCANDVEAKKVVSTSSPAVGGGGLAASAGLDNAAKLESRMSDWHSSALGASPGLPKSITSGTTTLKPNNVFGTTGGASSMMHQFATSGAAVTKFDVRQHYLQKARSMDPRTFAVALKEQAREEKVRNALARREEQNRERIQKNYLRDLRSQEMREQQKELRLRSSPREQQQATAVSTAYLLSPAGGHQGAGSGHVQGGDEKSHQEHLRPVSPGGRQTVGASASAESGAAFNPPTRVSAPASTARA